MESTALITRVCVRNSHRGPEFGFVLWIDELAKFPDPQAAFELQLAFVSKHTLRQAAQNDNYNHTQINTFFEKLFAQEGVRNLWKHI